MSISAEQVKATAQRVIKLEAEAVARLADELGDEIAASVDLILSAKGRVICLGMGKSGHIARKVAATFASTGTPALYVHPAEASHGDLGMITTDDVCLILSNSGETSELADVLTYAKRFSIPIIAITKNADSTLGRKSEVVLRLPDAPEACMIGRAPTTSTTCSLALGDAIAVALMEYRGIKEDAFLSFHPGGKLGAQLLPVAALMHTGAALPQVAPDTPMTDVLIEMTAKGFGIAAIVDTDDELTGVVTDGDLRRNMDNLMSHIASSIGSRNPRTIGAQALASEALAMMHENAITSVLVTDDQGRLNGLIHIHDCLRAGVA